MHSFRRRVFSAGVFPKKWTAKDRAREEESVIHRERKGGNYAALNKYMNEKNPRTQKQVIERAVFSYSDK